MSETAVFIQVYIIYFIIYMRNVKFFLLLFLAVVASVSGTRAQNLIDGYKRVYYADDLKDGKTYFLISDRTKYNGNSSGKPKGMSYKLDSYKISWDKPSEGIYFVYWGDFDAEEEGFQWVAEKVGDDQWAFKNVVKGEHLGVKNSYDDDVLFSATPVGYTLTDLDDGEGRFFMTSSENTHSPHVQGYLRSDRPNNSLAKQNVGDDDYPGDGATNGYPGRWQIYEADGTAPVNVWITDESEIKAGEQYYLVSDRTKFNGSSTSLPKAMACLQENFKINWGSQYVYWGDLDKEADGFIWTAEEAGEQWAFLNKENGKYIGNMNTGESDVIFSDTPVGYTLTDLEDGAGRFYMTNDESEHSLHVQGYLRSDRPNNSLAKQNVGDDNYPGDGATNGYPGRWKLLKVNPGTEEQSEFFSAANGYYNIVGSNSSSTEKNCWTESLEEYDGSSLIWNSLHGGDPFSIYYIKAVDREKGQYTISNYVTEKYVSNVAKDGMIVMTDEPQTLTFRTVQGERKALYVCNAAGDTLFVNDGMTLEIKHIFAGENTYNNLNTWKLQKLDKATLESPSAQLRLALARKVKEAKTSDRSSLSSEQAWTLDNLSNKAYEAVLRGVFDIIYEKYIADLDAAMKGEYTEPVYNKYEKKPLRVMSYNVKHCAGNKDGLNLPRTAQAIMAQHADVVALQELDSMFSSRSDYKYQVKELSEQTGMYGIFCSALTGYGIGMLCTELPLSVRVVALASDFEPRRMLIAEFRDYVFASLHVGLSASARRGTGPIIKAEAERWVETGKPLIIAGDFNDDGTDDEMQGARGVLTQYLQENGFTYHSDLVTPTWSDGTYVIDNIISYDPIGGVQKVSYEVVDDKVTSDHMPIVSDLIIGFDKPDAIGSTVGEDSASASGRVYHINGTAVSDSFLGNASLPGGIYIFNGKKILK